MKSSLLILTLIFSLIQNVLSQEKLVLSAEDLFTEIKLKSKQSTNSNKVLYESFLDKIKSDAYSEQTKNELAVCLFSHYIECGSFFSFQKAFEDHAALFENKPILKKYWETISLEFKEQYKAMLKSAEMLLRKSENAGDNQNISDAYRLLARSKMYLNEKDSSLLYANLSLNFAKRSDSKIAVAYTFRDLSDIQAHFDMIGKSTSTLLKLNQEAERIKDYRLLCWSTLMIAERSFQVNSFNEAKTYYRKALNIAEKNNLNTYKVRIFKGLTEIELSTNKLEAALTNINKGYNSFDKGNKSIFYFDFKSTHAKYLIEIDSLDEAKIILTDNLDDYSKYNSSRGLGKTHHLIGKLYFHQKKWKKAQTAFKQSQSILNNLPDSEYSLGNYKLLAQVFAEQNQFQRAFDNLDNFQKQIDNNSYLSSSKAINELTQMYSRELREYRIKEQERVIKDQQKEKELLSLKGEKQMATNVLIIIILISTIVIVLFYLRQAKINQNTKEIEMSQTLLRTQMNPHFIFNAMSVIQSSLYENNPAKSSKFLVSFSRLIRLILENSPKEFITLETEIEILEKYLKTQKLRFENRFDYQINVPEELIFKKALIPPMITQPFVENSIEHGQLNIIENGNISIDFSEKNNMLYIEIIDNGVGRAESGKKKNSMKEHKSMALDITNRRVEIINKKYKSKASITIGNLTDQKYTGTRVQIFLPLLNENLNFDSE